MGQRTVYSEGFIEQALEKVFSRGERTISRVAEQLGVNVWTLRGWMKKRVGQDQSSIKHRGTRQSPGTGRNGVERMQLLLSSQGLSEQELGAFCREHGIFAHQLERWRKEFEAGVSASAPAREELRELKQSKAKLERELKRKDKALAEAAALLVLQKKFNALWEDEGE